MCCDPYTNDNHVVGECSECGAWVDEEGEAVGEHCSYSPVLCEICGDAPCDLSC